MRKLLIVLFALICCAATAFGQKFDKKSTIIYHENEFQLAHAKKDTVVTTDPATGDEIMKVITYGARVQTMNGIRVYDTKELLSIPAPLEPGKPIELYLLRGLISDFNMLTDGIYRLFIYNMVIDNKGKIVYYQDITFSRMGTDITVPKEIEISINSRIDSLINRAPLMKPGTWKDKPVISSVLVNTGNYKITVNSHKTTFTNSP